MLSSTGLLSQLLQNLRWDDCKFKTSLRRLVRFYLRIKGKKKTGDVSWW